MSTQAFLSHRTTRDVKHYDIAWKSGATGAVPAFTSPDMHQCRGLVSITRDSTGQFTLVFERGGSKVQTVVGHCNQASFALTGATRAIFKSHTITASTKSVTVVFVTAPGALVDPSAGDIVHLTIGIKHSQGLA